MHSKYAISGAYPACVKRLEAGGDQRGESTAEHGLLAEEIGLGLFAEGRFENAGASRADAGSIRERNRARIAARILVHGDERGHAAPGFVLGAHERARPLRRNHEDVGRLGRHDRAEVYREAVRKREIGARA